MKHRRAMGLIVNPIAGMGGKVGLKGTDGAGVLEKALALGATPEAPKRAAKALQRLAAAKDRIRFFSWPGEMGESVLRSLGFEVSVLGQPQAGAATSAQDTERAARELLAAGAEILVFVGGDGTARDVYRAVADRIPVVGVPAGVKMHSGVFCTSAASAGELLSMYMEGKGIATRDAPVMDLDEDDYRNGKVSARLYGYLKVPYLRRLVQNAKVGRTAGAEDQVRGIAWDVIRGMEEGCTYVIGPGTTTRAIMEELGLPNTLIGVDVVRDRKIVANDVNEAQLLELVQPGRSKIVVTVIGGQGYLFGRGSQQISAGVLGRVGKENLIVVATKGKVLQLNGEPFLVDTGDEEMDRRLAGYVTVTCGPKEKLLYRVGSGTQLAAHGR